MFGLGMLLGTIREYGNRTKELTSTNFKFYCFQDGRFYVISQEYFTEKFILKSEINDWLKTQHWFFDSKDGIIFTGEKRG